jgi:hypothetical protein
VARLKYIPVEGATAVDVPLLPLPPDTRFAEYDGHRLPTIVRDNRGAHRFAIATNDTTDAALIADDAQGHVVGQEIDKLRAG